MNRQSLAQHLAVCSWSLRPATPRELLAHLQTTGLRRVQLALDPLREAPRVWGETTKLFRQNDVTIVSGMAACVGEDYSTLDRIRETGGITADATWEQNWRNFEALATLARQLELPLVTFHAGFIPHEKSDPNYRKIQHRLGQIADLFHGRGIAIALETGQETAATLRMVLLQLNRQNLGVNFDPANMILYDKGDPVEAVRQLGPWIRQVHLKDARRTRVPGTWGEEVRLGTGEVNWPAFFAALREMKFVGDLCIEREAGEQRAEDIRAARQFVEQIGV